jgi:hypothetical protein
MKKDKSWYVTKVIGTNGEWNCDNNFTVRVNGARVRGGWSGFHFKIIPSTKRPEIDNTFRKFIELHPDISKVVFECIKNYADRQEKLNRQAEKNACLEMEW